ncbi:hypothetical protein D3C81_1801760 [compost metagenome]
MLNQGLGHFTGTQQHHFAAQSLCQLLGGLQALACGFVAQPAVVDMHQAPWQVPTLSHTAGMAHQAFGLGIAIHTDQQTATQGRCVLTELTITVRQVSIDLGRCRLHGQFAQRREIGLAEKSIDRRAGLLGHIHLAFAQTLE